MDIIQTKVGEDHRRRRNFETENYLLHAKILFQQNEIEESKLLYREALKTDGWNLDAINGLIACIEKTATSEFARLELEKLHRARLKISPQSEHQLQTAKFYLEEKEPQLACKLLEKAALDTSLEEGAHFDIQRYLGNVYLQVGDLDHAEEAYHRAFSINGRSPALLTNLGTLDIQKNNWSQAFSRFHTAIEIDAGFDRAWVGLALCQKHLGDDQLAMASLRKAIDCAPDNQTAVHLFAHWCWDHGEIAMALRSVENYLDLVHPDLAMSRLYIQLCCEIRNWTKALWEIEKCLLHDSSQKDLRELEVQVRKELGAGRD